MVACILGLAFVLGTKPIDKDIDGQAAIDIVTQFAHRIGYTGKLSLTNVSSVNGIRWGFGSGSFQAVGLVTPNHRWMNGYVSPNGAIQMFQAMQPGVGNVRGAQVTSKASVIRRAENLIKIIGVRGPFKMRNVQVGQTDPFASTYFDILVNGRTFFNLNPTYGYRLDFNTIGGELTYFSRPPNIPEVDAKNPSISGAKAMALLEHWGKTHYRTVGGVAYLYGPSWRYAPTLVPEIGYYKFKNEEKARLVWQAHVWMHFDKRMPATESGLLGMYCDAVTGELIRPDDQGMG